jgi:RNA polymerase sigma factor (sigma-70 family)
MPSAPSLSGLTVALERLARSRDAEAWGFLLENIGADLQRLAARLTGESMLAEDAVQETLLQIRDHAGKFRNSADAHDAAARRWIFGVAANVCANLVRRRRHVRRSEAAAHMRPAMPERPEAATERNEQAEALRGALAELPERYRIAIILRHISGLAFEEVAAELRCPIGTAKTIVRRGLERMRSRLAGAGLGISLVMLTGALEQLPAAPITASTLGYAPLIGATTKSTLSFTSVGAFTMAAKFAILAASLLTAITASHFLRAEQQPPPSVQQPDRATLVIRASIDHDGNNPAHVNDDVTLNGEDIESLRRMIIDLQKAPSDRIAAIEGSRAAAEQAAKTRALKAIGATYLGFTFTIDQRDFLVYSGGIRIADAIGKDWYTDRDDLELWLLAKTARSTSDQAFAAKNLIDSMIGNRRSREGNNLKQILGSMIAYGHDQDDSWPAVVPYGISLPVKSSDEAMLVTAASFEWLAHTMSLPPALFESRFGPRLKLPPPRKDLAVIKAKPIREWACGYAYDWAAPAEVPSSRVMLAMRNPIVHPLSGERGVMVTYSDGDTHYVIAESSDPQETLDASGVSLTVRVLNPDLRTASTQESDCIFSSQDDDSEHSGFDSRMPAYGSLRCAWVK